MTEPEASFSPHAIYELLLSTSSIVSSLIVTHLRTESVEFLLGRSVASLIYRSETDV